MIHINEIIKKENYCISKDATIPEAIKMMSKNRDGFVVFTQDEKVIGVLTERDLVSYALDTNHTEESAFRYAHKSVITFKENRSLEYILMSLIEFNIRRVIIVDKNDNFLGVTTQEHLIGYVDNEAFKVKMKLSNLTSLHDIVSKDKDETINNILHCMEDNHIGSVVITDNDTPIGILTERDIVRLLNDHNDLSCKVSSVMSKPLLYCSIDDTIEYVLDFMNKKHIQRIIVKDNNSYKILGIRDIIHVIKGNYGVLVEKKLKHSKIILNSISEAILEIINIDDEYIVQWCNKEAFGLFGDNIIDKNITNIIDANLCDEILVKAKDNNIKFDYKIQINSSFYKLTCICDDFITENKFRLILFDITELEELNQNLKNKVEKKTQELQQMNNNLELRIKQAVEENKNMLVQLHRSEKMAALGEMLGNIAHQWRQPLSVISTNATGIIMKKEYNMLDDESLIHSCESINTNAQYLSNTIDDFKNFLKPEKDMHTFCLDEVFNMLFTLEESMIKKYEIEIIKDIDEKIKLYGYKNELIQALLNIFNNAKDAFLELDTDIRLLFISAKIIDNNVCIIFKDNANGIPENILNKIFEPYFTTKHQSQGTGLGLHMTYNIINQMNGKIDVSNQIYKYNEKEYKGAEFRIVLPLKL